MAIGVVVFLFSSPFPLGSFSLCLKLPFFSAIRLLTQENIPVLFRPLFSDTFFYLFYHNLFLILFFPLLSLSQGFFCSCYSFLPEIFPFSPFPPSRIVFRNKRLLIRSLPPLVFSFPPLFRFGVDIEKDEFRDFFFFARFKTQTESEWPPVLRTFPHLIFARSMPAHFPCISFYGILFSTKR